MAGAMRHNFGCNCGEAYTMMKAILAINGRKFLSILLSFAFLLSVFAGLSGACLAADSGNGAAYADELAGIARQLGEAELSYLEDYAETVNDNLGLVGFEDGFDTDPSAPIEVAVHFTELPSEVLLLYDNTIKSLSTTRASAEATAISAYSRFTSELSSRLPGKAKDITVLGSFYQYFNGAIITAPAETVKAIAALPGVHSVTPSYTFKAMDDGPPAYASSAGLGMKGSRDLFDLDYIHDSLGINGSGVLVGVLDTGCDYRHPDFEGAFLTASEWSARGGTGSPYGRDEITGTFSRRSTDAYYNTPMEMRFGEWRANWSSYSQFNSGGETFYTYHGTHVSGIVAGTGRSGAAYATTGMAPGAKLRVYRCLSAYGTGQSADIIRGIEHAANDGCKVINMSIGVDVNNPYGAENVAINNAIITKDIVFCVAAGNAGPGRATIGTLASAMLSITVANGVAGGESTDYYPQAMFGDETAPAFVVGWPTLSPYETFGSDGAVKAAAGLPLNLTADGYEFVYVGNGEASDFSSIPDGGLAGKVAVIQRNTAYFTDMADRVVAKKGGALVIINNSAGGSGKIEGITLSGSGQAIPVLNVSYSNGAKIQSVWNGRGGNPVYMKLGNLSSLPANNTLASSSSTGPVNTIYAIKPDVTAPGTEILSTVPAYMTNSGSASNPPSETTGWANAYKSFSGTSMASPHVAGFAALMRQKFPGSSASEIKARMMNNAQPLSVNTSVFQTGAGFIVPKASLLSDAYVTVTDTVTNGSTTGTITNATLASLSFRAFSGSESRELRLTIFNSADVAREFHISAAYNDSVSTFSAPCVSNGVSIHA